MDCTIDISVDDNSLSILGLNHPPLDCCSSVSVEDVVLRLLCDMKVEAVFTFKPNYFNKMKK